MNKLEKISLHSALKTSKPPINLCFFPIPFDKYITFEFFSKEQSKDYKFWQDVIDFISPFLEAEGIKILRIGSHNKKQIDGIYQYTDKTFGQNSYIISKSMLHFNANSCLSLVANQLNIPLVCIFSSSPSDFFPFNKGAKDFFIDAPQGGKNRTFAKAESPKTIDNISPNQIASAILNSLGINNNLSSLNRVFNGDMSHIKTIEIIPDFMPPADLMTNSLINVRADYFLDENLLFAFSQNRQMGIITDKPLSENILLSIRSRIQRVSVNCDGGLDSVFLKNLKKFGIPYELFTTIKEGLNEVRLKNIDETIEFYERKKKPIDFSVKSDYSLEVKSSKILISKGKTYASKAHWITNQETSADLQPFIDTSDFWEDSDFLTIYESKK